MKALEERILRDGKILAGDVLKVDSFINHQIDISLMNDMGREFRRLFDGCGVNKILTIEASGIAVACIAAQYFDNAPVVFAKKSKTSNLGGDVFAAQAHSYTHGTTNNIVVSKSYLSPADNVLILDDFLATGSALLALIEIVRMSGARVCGAGAVIEKSYQGGGDKIRSAGVVLHSLACIKSMSEDKIEFCE